MRPVGTVVRFKILLDQEALTVQQGVAFWESEERRRRDECFCCFPHIIVRLRPEYEPRGFHKGNRAPPTAVMWICLQLTFCTDL